MACEQLHKLVQRLSTSCCLVSNFEIWPQFRPVREVSDERTDSHVLLRLRVAWLYACASQAENRPMCLVAIAWKIHPRWRLLMAGNRDEFHGRPTAALARWLDIAGDPGGSRPAIGGNLGGHGRAGALCGGHQCAGSPGDELRAFPRRTAGRIPWGDSGACRMQRPGPPGEALSRRSTCCWWMPTPATTWATIRASNNMPSRPASTPCPMAASTWPGRRHAACAKGLADGRSGKRGSEPLWNALADEHIAADEELPDTGVGIELERLLSPPSSAVQLRHPRQHLIAIDYEGRGFISERRFGPHGVFEGETTLRNDSSA